MLTLDLLGKSTSRYLGMLICLILFAAARTNLQAQYVHTSGTEILDENGDPLFFTGINLGNWLLWEGYLMMGDFNYRTHTQFFNSVKDAFGGDLNKALEFEHQWRLNYVTSREIEDLKALGFNSVRVPFHFNMFWDYDNNTTRDHGFQYFDSLISYCRANDMYILLDMHAAPGYQNPGDHSDNVNSDASQPRETVEFWDGNNVQIAADVWRHIAARYANETIIWGYDLINEPVPQPNREYELLPSLITMRNAIREVDNNHIIVAEGSWWSSDLTKIDWSDPVTQAETGITSQWDNNLVYQLHHYSGNYAGDGPILDQRLSIATNLNVPLIMGEYGEADESGIRAMSDWCIQNEVGYFPWSFKKMSHDRTLWTIPPNAAYEQLKRFVNNGTTPPGNLYNNMIAFCQNNITNGAPDIIWHQGFYDAVKFEIALTCEESSAFSVPGRLEAENYCGALGIQTETTSDVGGGSNVGFVDPGDYLDYRIDVPASGDYNVLLRLASGDENATNKTLELQAGSTTVPVTYNTTGGWQTWATVTASMNLTAGTQTLRINFTESGQNLNWIEFDAGTVSVLTSIEVNPTSVTLNIGETQQFVAQGLDQNGNPTNISPNWTGADAQGLFTAATSGTFTVSASQGAISGNATVTVLEAVSPCNASNATTLPAQIEAEDFCEMNGITTENTSDTGGGQNVGFVDAGDWLDFQVDVPTAGDYQLEYRVAADGSGSRSFDVITNAGTLNQSFNTTGGWQNWATVTATINLNAGNQTIRLLFQDSGINMNWIRFSTNSLSSIVVTPANTTLEVGASQQLVATGFGTNGGEMSINPSWSGADANGLFTATTSGTFTITASDQGVSGSATITVNELLQGFAIPGLIEAEDYTAMNGIQTENTSDTGGGLNIGYVNSGDWVDYAVNVATSGTYNVSVRVAANGNAQKNIELQANNTTSNINFLGTGGWQNWSTISTTIDLSAGAQVLRLYFASNGINVNWIEFEESNGSGPYLNRIEAESFTSQSGIQTENCSEGGQNVGYIDDNDWITFDNVAIPADGNYTISYRVATGVNDGTISLRNAQNQSTYGTVNVSGSGSNGWQDWRTISHTVYLNQGSQDLRIFAQTGGFNINWFEIASSQSGARMVLETPTVKQQEGPIQVYPNPVAETLWIRGSDIQEVHLINTEGKQIPVILSTSGQGYELDVRLLKKGLYFLELTREDGKRTKHKILKD